MRKILFFMFSISIIVLLSSCSIYKYEEFDLTLDNYTDYFNRLEFEKVEIDGARFFQEDKTSITLSTLFAVDEYKISNYYYDNVVFSFQVNLYYGDSIVKGVEPTYSYKLDSKLIFNNYDDGTTSYLVGCLIGYKNISYYPNSGKNIQLKEFIVFEDDTIVEGEWQYCREVIITAISGVVKKGGLAALNEYHCS